ncbi:NAD-P-binding protein [Auriscalpium vulgare]|uniref:NAD-P-binding protein n=1 Tax=Auriscalpium vulgare TaxID=40419 RepID=A0ACB8RLY9_9AGAM|nr:NAD-P-binding protein [Auriscalpium vulgare]
MSQSLPQFKKGFQYPLQDQNLPGLEHKLDPAPVFDITADGKPYKAAGKLEDQKAIVTGADSGIGRSVALLYALEGADLTLTYLPQEKDDVQKTVKLIEEKTNGTRKVQVLEMDLRSEKSAKELVEKHLNFHNSLTTLALNHGRQMANTDITTLSSENWHETFDTNMHSFFYIVKHAVSHMSEGSSIVFNASINFAVGHPELLDYTATKGAIVAFMRALSNQIVGERGIRVNAVAPGPIWTPLIVSTMTEDSKKTFGQSVPIGRAGQPIEVATSFVFLSSADSSYITGQVLHVNGGVVIN